MDSCDQEVMVTGTQIEQISHSLAMHLVAGLAPPEEILKRFSITPQQFNIIKATPRFKQLYAEAKRQWESDDNAKDRIRQKASSLVEELMLDMFSIASDNDVAPSNRLDSFRTLAKMGGVEGVPARQQGDVDTGPGFVVNINLVDPTTNEKEVFTIDGSDSSTSSV